MQFSDVCTDALRAMTAELAGEKIEVSNFGDALKAFERFKNSGTNAALIKERLAFDDNRLKEFMAALRKLREYLQASDDGESSRRNIQIASLRLLDWFAEISKSLPSLVPIAMKGSADLAKNQSFKQIRAAELVIRSLINEKYASQERVLKLIRDLFKNDPATVSRIEKNAEPGDILSGTEFSQLIALFLRPDEFSKNYHPLYDSTPFLGYLRDKRQTLVLFLDDIRRIRNRIAHHRPLTSAQIELLDLYYDEIIGPIQTAHDEGRIGVNPESHLEIGEGEINAFVSSLKEDLGDIKDVLSRVSSDIGEIKEALGDVSTGVIEAKGGVQWLQRNAKWVSGGILLLTVIAFTSMGLIERTHQATLDVKKDTSDIKSDTTDIKAGIQTVDAKLANVKQETSSDPRKELSNMGVQWSNQGFGDSLLAGDTKVVGMFIQSGWDPLSSYGEGNALGHFIWRSTIADPKKYQDIFQLLFAKGLSPTVPNIRFRGVNPMDLASATTMSCNAPALQAALMVGADRNMAIETMKKAVFILPPPDGISNCLSAGEQIGKILGIRLECGELIDPSYGQYGCRIPDEWRKRTFASRMFRSDP